MKRNFFLFLALLFPSLLFAQVTPELLSRAQSGDIEPMLLVALGYENGAGVEQDSAQALQWYRKAAEKGSTKAWMQIALYHLTGSQMPADTARCYAIRKEWADKGDPDAIAYYGNCYMNGFGVKADSAQAFALWETAAKKGSTVGLINLALISPQLTDEERIAKLKKVAKKDFDSRAIMSDYYYEQGDYEKAWTCIEEGLKWNHPTAMYVASTMLFRFDIVTQQLHPDMSEAQAELEAQRLIEKAITLYPTNDELLSTAALIYTYSTEENRNLDRAQFHLRQGDRYDCNASRAFLASMFIDCGAYDSAAFYLDHIIHTRQNRDEYAMGEACYQLAGIANIDSSLQTRYDPVSLLVRGANEFNNARCAMALAQYYESLPKENHALDIEHYYLLADKLGQPEAIKSLGIHYAMADDSRRAAECFQKMVDRGDADGYTLLARLASEEGNNDLWISLLEEGSKNGNSDCAEMLGDYYAGYFGSTSVNYKKAVKYYKKAQNGGAYYSLALLYLQGEIGKQSKKDIAKGINYMEKSAYMGYVRSIYLMGNYYETGQYVDSINLETALIYYMLLADNDVAAGIYKAGQFFEQGLGGLPHDTVQALEYYRRAADMDYGEACVHLGDLYREGKLVTADEETAFHYYTHAVLQENADGAYKLACCYLEGISTDVDSTEAVSWLRQATYLGSGDAAFLLAEFHNYARAGLEANGDTAIHYYQLAHQYGNAEASRYLGQLLASEGYYKEAVEYFYTSAQRGSIDGAVLLASCLQEGIGIEANPVAAYQLLETVCHESNNARAYTQIGLACLQGLGCPENELLGMTYLDTAAHLGSSDAMYYLGICYLQGFGCEPDSATAMIWLNKAMDNGSAAACNLIGDLYEAREEYTDAVRCYEKAVELGSLNGYCNLGYCYETGHGVVLNSQKAYELYKTAADNGSARGCKLVASCYLEGIYVEASPQKAMEWYLHAAELGDAEAMFYIGALYEQGEEGIERDPKAAKQWYERAAAMGSEAAEAALSRLKKK